MMPIAKYPVRFSAGVVVVRRANAGWRYLILRSYSNWDFPKGGLEPGETPLEAAIRETREEADIADLDFLHGHDYRDTSPYGRGKVARYFLASTRHVSITLPVSPTLGHPEHHEWRWVSADEAKRLLPERLQPILQWARERLDN